QQQQRNGGGRRKHGCDPPTTHHCGPNEKRRGEVRGRRPPLARALSAQRHQNAHHDHLGHDGLWRQRGVCPSRASLTGIHSRRLLLGLKSQSARRRQRQPRSRAWATQFTDFITVHGGFCSVPIKKRQCRPCIRLLLSKIQEGQG